MKKMTTRLGNSSFITVLWIVLTLVLLFLPGSRLLAQEETPRHSLLQRVTQAVNDSTDKSFIKIISMGFDVLEEKHVVRLDGRFDNSEDSFKDQRQRLKHYLSKLNEHFIVIHRVSLGSRGDGTFSLWLSAQRIPETTVVLMAQEDGTVGEVVVSSKREPDKEQVLDKPGHGIVLGSDPQKVPKIFVLTDKEINHRFAPLLKIKSERPKTFLIFFGLSSSRIKSKGKMEMQQIFAEIARRSFPEVEVVGHTDLSGSEAENIIISRRRAEMIADFIKKNTSLNPTQISVVSMGERQPLVLTADSIVEPRNRRVEVTIR